MTFYALRLGHTLTLATGMNAPSVPVQRLTP